MVVRRRRALLLLAISTFVFTYLVSREEGFPNLIPGFGHAYQYPQNQAENFQWNDVPIQFPLKYFRSTPRGSPKSLPKIQHDFPEETPTAKELRLERRDAVKKSFQRCYRAYREHAWMSDELRPVSAAPRDTFGGWAATLVDSLDTLAVMGMKEELREAVHAVKQIDFSNSSALVINIFETNIRYLGGFLGAYDLTGSDVLLEKAVEVGEMLLVAFDTPNHMPVPYWHWETAQQGISQSAPDNMVVAQLGSFSMEFTRLSQITGDMRWYDAAARITDLFYKQRKKSLIPGMFPVSVNAKRLDLTTGTSFTIGAMADSLYEYFPKMYALLGGLESTYKKLYQVSMKACIKHLFFRPMVPQGLDILIAGDVNTYTGVDMHLDPQGQHLGCFAGGMLALGGKLFNMPQHVDIGMKLTDGCIWAYNSSANGIMPEVFYTVACESTYDCDWDELVWREAVQKRYNFGQDDDVDDIIDKHNLRPGFLAYGDKSYILRPEALESVFFLYRITGKKYLQDAAWEMYQAIEKLTKTEYGNSAIYDITSPPSRVAKKDEMESFWMAETLKYLYLIFSEPELISLDEYVFNTEAHPFKLPK